MKKYPKYIERIDDGELFIRNQDNTYSLLRMIRDYPKSFTFKYEYDVLMKKHKGSFRHYTRGSYIKDK